MLSYVAACFACCLAVLTFSTHKVVTTLNSIKTSDDDFKTEKFNLILMLAVFDFSFLIRIVFSVFYFPKAFSDPNNYFKTLMMTLPPTTIYDVVPLNTIMWLHYKNFSKP